MLFTGPMKAQVREVVQRNFDLGCEYEEREHRAPRVRKNAEGLGMTNDDERASGIHSIARHEHRGTIKQWDRAGFGRILKKERTSAGRRIRDDEPFPLSPDDATYVSTFVSRGRSTPSKSITSDDVPMAAVSRNAHNAHRADTETNNKKIYETQRAGEGKSRARALFVRAAAFPRRKANPIARSPFVPRVGHRGHWQY